LPIYRDQLKNKISFINLSRLSSINKFTSFYLPFSLKFIDEIIKSRLKCSKRKLKDKYPYKSGFIKT